VKSALLIAIAAAAIFAGQAQAAPPSRSEAARSARDCLRAHGWWAILADDGTTVNSRAPRKLAGYPYKPWYSVTFYTVDFSPRYAEIRMKLNRSEAKVATLCRNSALR